MSVVLKAVPLSDSESDLDDDGGSDDERKGKAKKRVKIASESLERTSRQRFTGGIIIRSEDETKEQSTSASVSAAEKRKDVEDLERELDLKNTFSRETNRRDEDAEMNKYIDEQIKLKREAAKRERQKSDKKSTDEKSQEDSDFLELFNLPTTATDKIEDILLHSISRNLTSTTDEKSETMLSSQMLNGIPEVDLGIDEKIRTIEATEEAKFKMATSSSRKAHSTSTVPVNYSSNFRQHRNHRDTHDGELKTSKYRSDSRHTNSNNRDYKTVTEAVVVVGAEPSEIEYRVPATNERPPPRGKASDDYYLSKFKKNNRK